VAKPDAIQPIGKSKKICFMLYGPPGGGKTRLIGERERTLIVRPPQDHLDSIRTTGAEEWTVYDWSEMYNVREFAKHEGRKWYDWIWLDSISLFQDTGLDDIWEGVIAQKPHRAQYQLDKGEYGVNMWRLQQWVRDMVGFPGFNLGITAHPAELINPLNGEAKLQPWVQGKNMSTKIQGYMNIVGYLEVVDQKDGPRRVLRTHGTDKFEAKDQFDAFAKGRLVDPTMTSIEAAIAASRNGRVGTRRRTKRRPTKRAAATRRS
jgi:AAA domain